MDRQHGGCLRTTGGSEELAVGRKSPPFSLKAARYLPLQLFTFSKGGVLVWECAQLPGHPWRYLPRGRERAGDEAVLPAEILRHLLLQEDLTASALLHPQASLCCSLTLLQLHRVPQIQSPFPSLCSLLPGAQLICFRFLPQLQ